MSNLPTRLLSTFSVIHLCFVLLTNGVSASSLSDEWSFLNLGNGLGAGRSNAVDIDRSGGLHTAFTEDLADGGGKIVYALRERPTAGGIFTSQGEVRSYPAAESPRHLSMAAADDGTVHLVYVLANGALVHASRELGGSGWSFATLDSTVNVSTVSGGTSLRRDPSGRLHLAYTDSDGRFKVLFHLSGHLWLGTLASPPEGVQGHNAIAVPGTTPSTYAVLHRDGDSGRLRISEYSGSVAAGFSWRVTHTFAEQTGAGSGSLVRLPTGGLAVCLQAQLGGGVTEVRYYERRGAGAADPWSAAVRVESSSQWGENWIVGRQTDLALDVRGNPRVAYTRGEFELGLLLKTRRIVVAYRFVDQEWRYELANGSGICEAATRDISMAVNGAGDPVLVFECPSDTAGRSFAKLAQPSCAPWVQTRLQADSSDVASDLSTVVTRDGTVVTAATCSRVGGDGFLVSSLKLFTTRAGHTTCTTIFESGTVEFRDCAIALKPNGELDLVALQSDGLLRHFRLAGLEATASSVVADDADLSGVDLQLAADGRGTLHLVYSGGDGALRYATLAGGADLGQPRPWGHRPTATTATRRLAMAVRGDGAIVIVYADGDQVHVQATLNADGSRSQTFDTSWTQAVGSIISTVGVAFVPDRTFRVVACKLETGTVVQVSEGVLDQVIGRGISAQEMVMLPTASGSIELVMSDPSDTFRIHFRERPPGAGHVSILASATVPDVTGYLSGLGAALDPSGFPVIVAPGERSQPLMMVRPADSIDDDRDGIPLAAENAFGLDPTVDDAFKLASFVAVEPAGDEIRFSYTFDMPGAAASAVLSRNTITRGEFHYGVAGSTDLRASEIFLPVGVAAESSAIAGTGEITLTVSAGFIAANPRYFTRLWAQRIRF